MPFMPATHAIEATGPHDLGRILRCTRLSHLPARLLACRAQSALSKDNALPWHTSRAASRLFENSIELPANVCSLVVFEARPRLAVHH